MIQTFSLGWLSTYMLWIMAGNFYVRNYFIASDQPDIPHAPQTTEECWEFGLNNYCEEFG